MSRETLLSDVEPVTLQLFEDVPRNQPPVPVVTTSQKGSTVIFDATGTTDPDGTVVEYRWDFADGSTASGPVVTRTFAPGTYDITLTATDDDGAKGFGHTDERLQVGSDPTAATVYSGSSLTPTNSFSAAGKGADLLVDGDFRCNSQGHVAGDVTVLGAAYLTNTCRVDGTLWAAGGVTMDATARVGGDVVAAGAVRLQSTARVAGDIRTASSFTVTDGVSVSALRAKGSLGGTVVSGAAVTGPGPVAPAEVAAEPASGQEVTPWDTVGDDTWVDARNAITGCGVVSLQGLTLRLSGDLTLVVDGLQSTNGMRVVSADGETHTLRVLVPGSIGAPTTAGAVTLLTGVVAAGRIVAAGAVTVRSPEGPEAR